jgi:DNA polymerase III delta prime subunit
MSIIGLQYITDKIDSYTLDTFPHSIILVGKEGCGKHVISNYIADKFKCELIDITYNLSDELISNMYRTPLTTFYLVDLRKITEKDQNILLKVFEEPSSNIFIILLSNNTLNILPTVLNRGYILNIGSYKLEDLLEYAQYRNLKLDIDNYIFKYIIETPGDIEKILNYNISLKCIKELTDKIINKLSIASFSNTLTIVNKLNFKDEYDKIDVDFFLKMLYVSSSESYITENNIKSLSIFKSVKETLCKLVDSRLNKKILISNMLANMWRGVRL